MEFLPEPDMPWKNFHKYFAFMRKLGTQNFEVVCKLCLPKATYINCKYSSPLLLKKHLVNNHQWTPERVRKEFGPRQVNSKRTEVINHSQKREVAKVAAPAKTLSAIDQARERAEEATADLIVNEGLPLRLVDSVYFRKMVEPKGYVIGDREHIAKRISVRLDTMRLTIHAELSSVANVATSVDCWTKLGRTLLAITVHWIDEYSMERRSAALALRRINGPRLEEVAAATICMVHSDFEMTGKVRHCITDGAANLRVALMESDPSASSAGPAADGQTFQLVQQKCGPNLLELNLADVSFMDTEGMLLAAAMSEDGLSLPPIHRCGSHILNLIAFHDVRQVYQHSTNPALREIHNAVETKLNKWWARQAESTQEAEILNAFFGRSNTLDKNNWISQYNSKTMICDLLSTNPEKFHEILDMAQLPRLSHVEVNYLREFVMVTKPLAHAFHFLQSKEHMFLGYLLPTIYNLKRELEMRRFKPLAFCLPLLQQMIATFDTDRRFGLMLNDRFLIMAACLVPLFKLDWDALPDATAKDDVRQLILQEMEEVHGGTHPCVLEEDQEPYTEERIADELNRFLSAAETPVSLSIKQCYGPANGRSFVRLKRLFMFYNTALPSSASAGRLFALVGAALRSDLSNLTDDELEQNSLLSANEACV